MTSLIYPLQDVDIQLQGNINLPSDIATVQAGVTGKHYRSAWFLVQGTKIRLVGPNNSKKGGVINSFGQQWWDAVQQVRPFNSLVQASSLTLLSSSDQPSRTHRVEGQVSTSYSLSIARTNHRASNGTVNGITISKPIGKSFNVGGNGNLFENIVIDAKSTSSAFPFNTDGFDSWCTCILVQRRRTDAACLQWGATATPFKILQSPTATTASPSDLHAPILCSREALARAPMVSPSLPKVEDPLAFRISSFKISSWLMDSMLPDTSR